MTCGGWAIQDYGSMDAYVSSPQFPIWCDVHDCDAWNCFTDLPPPALQVACVICHEPIALEDAEVLDVGEDAEELGAELEDSMHAQCYLRLGRER